MTSANDQPETAPVVIAPKKRPGRPKKAVISQPPDHHGICTTPFNAEDVVELVHYTPLIFKKIVTLLRGYDVANVNIDFGPEGIRILSQDHFGGTSICITINGNCMYYYYCKAPLRVSVKCENMENIFMTLAKTHSKITLISKAENYRSFLYVLISDGEYDATGSYEIGVIYAPDNSAETAVAYDDSAYPILFTVSSKYFKKLVSDISKISKMFIVQKDGAENLQLTSDRKDGISWTGTYNNAEKIHLVSKLAPNEIFSASVPIDDVKPFSSSNTGEEVTIAADKVNRISFTTRIDKYKEWWTMVIKVFIKINGPSQ